MDEREIEDLIRSFEGPQPSPETTRRILNAARPEPEVIRPGSNMRIAVRASARRPARWFYALAAACVCAAVGLWIVRVATPSAVATLLTDDVQVHRGEILLTVKKNETLLAGDQFSTTAVTRCRLTDGSEIKIDKDATVAFERPGSGERARVRVEAGRALLRVAKAPGAFIVAGSAAVRVLGTCFGVEEKNGQTSVSVLEGVVALNSNGGEVKLTRGQSGAAGASMAPQITPGDPNAMLLWARESARFENRPLSEVLSWIAANSSFRFDTSNLRKQYQVTVTVGEEPIRQVIEALLLSCNLEYAVNDQTVTVGEP